MSRRRDKCASSEGGIIRGYAAWAELRESGETGRRAGLRIQWAKSPWGFDSPLSHQHRDLLRGRISGLRVPCAKPSAGLLDASQPGRRGRESLYLEGVLVDDLYVEPDPRTFIPSCSTTTIRLPLPMRHSPAREGDCATLNERRAAWSATAKARRAVVVAAAFPPAAGECWRVPSRCLCSGRPPLERSRGRRPRTRERRQCRPLSRSFAADP